MVKSTRKEKGLFKIGLKRGRESTIDNLRNKIIVILTIFFIIILIYHTYFESDTNKKDGNDTTIPTLLKSNSISIFQNNDNNTIDLRNPTIAMDQNGKYFVAFEKVDINGSTGIFIIRSNTNNTWTEPIIPMGNLTDATKPYLKYIQGNNLVLTFESGGKYYFQISNNGFNWTSPEPGQLFLESDMVYYSNDFHFLVNSTGLWLFNYNNLNEDRNYVINLSLNSNDGPHDDSTVAKQIFRYNFTNPSLMKVNNEKFLIVHDKSMENLRSINLTTIYFKYPEEGKISIKWDLLAIFLIIGLFLLLMIVKEVARD